jgi:YggT family protein
VTPVVWVGVISLLRELLVGQQGLITQLLRHSGSFA